MQQSNVTLCPNMRLKLAYVPVDLGMLPGFRIRKLRKFPTFWLRSEARTINSTILNANSTLFERKARFHQQASRPASTMHLIGSPRIAKLTAQHGAVAQLDRAAAF
jgi:outer membrane receptor for Fe3+-dicitrate